MLFVEGVSSFFGFVGGISLVADPTGSLLGVPLSLLSSLPIPVHDFFLPGLWLLLVFGAGFALVTYLLRSAKPHASSVALLLGVVWLGWISFEVIFIGVNPVIWIWFLPQVVALALLARLGRS